MLYGKKYIHFCVVDILVIFCASYSFANVLYVKCSTISPGAGTSWLTAFQTIQPAINAAAIGDEIWVAQGLYNEIRTGKGAIILNKQIALYGGFSGTESNHDDRNPEIYPTIIDGSIAQSGAPAENVIEMNSRTIVDGFEIRGAAHDGILVKDTYSTIRSCKIYNNGRGVEIQGAYFTLTDCRIHDNSGETSGGGLLAMYSGDVARCSFIKNSATDEGGGICVMDPYLFVIRQCMFSENHASSGGAIKNESGPMNIIGCTFSNNKGSAAIHFRKTWEIEYPYSDIDLQVTNCLFVNNDFYDIYHIYYPHSQWICGNTCFGMLKNNVPVQRELDNPRFF